MSDPQVLTPQERLAASRQAILRHMTKDDRSEPKPSAGAFDNAVPEADSSHGMRRSFSSISRAARAWWQHQPLHFAFDMAVPVVGRFADRQPLKLLAVAAAAGAVLVLVRPWRLISLGGLMLAAVKSTATPGILMSLLSSSPSDPSTHSNTDSTHAQTR